MRFTVLASGSAGNASLIQGENFGILIDVGLGPRQLAERLGKVGESWSAVQAVLLTHTHSDHWKDATLSLLYRRRIPLYCHQGHLALLQRHAAAFTALQAEGLLKTFEPEQEVVLSPALRFKPLPVRHDSGATFAFRVEGSPDLFGRATALAYAADLGCWDEVLVEQLREVDLLALEFNHDVSLERSSGRSASLINRVLGDEGHLSNDQAAALLRALLLRSPSGRLRHVVQLHLSRDCNRPNLAAAAARAVLAELDLPIELHTASPDQPLPTLHLGTRDSSTRQRRLIPRRRPVTAPSEPWLPGLENA